MKSFFNRKADPSSSQPSKPPPAPSASYKFWASTTKQPGSSSSNQAPKREKGDVERPPSRAQNAEPSYSRASKVTNGYNTDPGRSEHSSRKPIPFLSSSSRQRPPSIAPQLPHQQSYAYGTREPPTQEAYRSDEGYATEPIERSRDKLQDRELRRKERERSTSRRDDLPDAPRRERRHVREVSEPIIRERDDRRRLEQHELEARRKAQEEEARQRRKDEERRKRHEERERLRQETAAVQESRARKERLKRQQEEEAARTQIPPENLHNPGSSQDYYTSIGRSERPRARPPDEKPKLTQQPARIPVAESSKGRFLARETPDEQESSDSSRRKREKLASKQARRQRESIVPSAARPVHPPATVRSSSRAPDVSAHAPPLNRTLNLDPPSHDTRSRSNKRDSVIPTNTLTSSRREREYAPPEPRSPPATAGYASTSATTRRAIPSYSASNQIRIEPPTPSGRVIPQATPKPAPPSTIAPTYSQPPPSIQIQKPDPSFPPPPMASPAPAVYTSRYAMPSEQSEQLRTANEIAKPDAQQSLKPDHRLPPVLSSASASAAATRTAPSAREPDNARLQVPTHARYGNIPIATVPSTSSAQSQDSDVQRAYPQSRSQDRKASASQSKEKPRAIPPYSHQRRATDPVESQQMKHSPIHRFAQDDQVNSHDESEEVILPVPVPRSLGLQPLYGPPEDEVRAELHRVTKQREASHIQRPSTAMASPWNAPVESPLVYPSPAQRPTHTSDNVAVQAGILRPSSVLPQPSASSSRYPIDARTGQPHGQGDNFTTVIPVQQERSQSSQTSFKDKLAAADTRPSVSFLSPKRPHARQLSEPMIRDLSGAKDASPDPYSRPSAEASYPLPQTSSSRYPYFSATESRTNDIGKNDDQYRREGVYQREEPSRRDERPSPRQVAPPSHTPVAQPGYADVSRAMRKAEKKRAAKNAKLRSTQEPATDPVEATRGYLSPDIHQATNAPSHSSESPASKRSDGNTPLTSLASADHKPFNATGATPPLNVPKTVVQASPSQPAGVIDLSTSHASFKHPRLEELLSDPVRSESSKPAVWRSDMPMSSASAQAAATRGNEKRPSPVTQQSARLKSSPAKDNSEHLPSSSDPYPYRNPYGRVKNSPDMQPAQASDPTPAHGATAYNAHWTVQHKSSPNADINDAPQVNKETVTSTWTDRVGVSAPAQPSRAVNTSSRSTKPQAFWTTHERPEIRKPTKPPSVRSRSSHDSFVSLSNHNPSPPLNMEQNGDTIPVGGVTAELLPVVRDATANKIFGGEQERLSRVTSQDSILRTPSSLAQSAPLKPAWSRASQQASNEDAKKKGGILRMFRTNSKPEVPTSTSQTSLWKTTTKDSDAPSEKKDAPSKLLKKSTPHTDGETADRVVKAKRPPPIAVPNYIPAPPDRERKSPHAGGGVFTPFRYLTSKRHRTVSAASVDVADGYSTVPNTLGSPTASMHSSTPMPPPLRDPRTATQEWRDVGRGERHGKTKIKRPGVVFEVDKEMHEDKQTVKTIKPSKTRTSSRPRKTATATTTTATTRS